MRIYDLYSEIAQRLKSHIPEIRYCDWWAHQHRFEEHHPFPTPAAFIHIKAGDIMDLGELHQQIYLHLSVYLLDIIPMESYNGKRGQATDLPKPYRRRSPPIAWS